jgi:asparagine synthase (glutamine-hydrolysing)
MTDTLKHRGPDDFGVWTDVEVGVALGHRRLSILDLSAAGRQPMVSESGRFVISYNGEIYNFLDLREELTGLGHRFHGHSDTEVLLAAISQWGIEKTLDRIQGMFAFALWDRYERALILARDRVGKKPLYYGWCGDTFLFGSELKALRAHPDFDAEIDRNALGLLVQYAWIPSPYSIFKHIRKLQPGTFLTITPWSKPSSIRPLPYWSAKEVAERGERNPFSGSLQDATDELEALLRDAVRGRMISDVSLGALLSGGIDSTTVVSLMQSLSSTPVKTFSIGFLESSYNEAKHAKAIARYLGTDHTELYVTAADSLKVIPQLPTLYDEPFADPSEIPTFLVSRLARSEVTVALSGDGGDELFAGYRIYYRCLHRWKKYGHLPLSLRRSLASLMGTLERHAWAMLNSRDLHSTGGMAKLGKLAKKFAKGSERLAVEGPVQLFARQSTRCKLAHEFVLNAEPVPTVLTDAAHWADISEPLQSMMYLHFVDYLTDDILVKVDRASMAVSLEVRCPILDHRVVELAWRLPLHMRVDQDGGKRIFKKVLERYVPRELTERPKKGFGIPLADWLRGPLRDWAEELLDEERLQQESFFVPDSVRRVWRQHLAGWQNHCYLLWNILMFQAWLESWSQAGHSR